MKRFALAGNPNCGKTTLFNALTGSTAYVGNWPGVTVEQRKGKYKHKGVEEVEIIDLPGIYSLSPYTPEEVISRNYILDEKPDCVINIIDASNLERNLYLTTQLLEMDVPVVVALNMMDVIEKAGEKIDVEALERKLGVPVIAITATKNKGIHDLIKLALQETADNRRGSSVLTSTSIKKEVEGAKKVYEKAGIENPLFHAIKALEKDEVELKVNEQTALEVLKEFENKEKSFDEVSADERYKYISKDLAVYHSGSSKEARAKLTVSDKIDRVLTNRWAGIPIFLLVLLLVFALTFSSDLFFLNRWFGVEFEHASFAGTMFEGLIWTEEGINSPGVILANFVNAFNGVGDFTENVGWGGIMVTIDSWTAPLLDVEAMRWFPGFVDSVLADGVFAVIGFLPQILVLFLFFSILEDCGYMARVAFIFDRIFRKMGLSGRAFIPMLMGFGCSVPAMINTRTLNTDKERISTIRVIPFFTCGAKAELLSAVAGVLASTFGLNAVLVSYGFYVGGMILAIAVVILMHLTTLREKVPPFIMELPAYHAPQFKALMIHMWDKTKHYLKKASTIIVLAAIFIWLFTHLSFTQGWIDEPAELIAGTDVVGYHESVLGQICYGISYIFTPLGFGAQVSEGWAYSLSTIMGLVAKEVVPATLEEIGLLDEAALAASGITTGGFLGFITMSMFTIPCFASVGTAKGELPKGTLWKTVLFWLGTGYVFGALMYITVDFTWTLALTLPLIAGIYVAAFFYNKKKTKEELEALEAKEKVIESL